LRRFAFIGLALIAVVMVGCGLGDGGTEQEVQSRPRSGAWVPKKTTNIIFLPR
jgi:hypothetical protein